MSVSSVSQSSTAITQQAALAKSERTESGPDHDGDADDAGVKAIAPTPTVNTSGQTIGTVISTKA